MSDRFQQYLEEIRAKVDLVGLVKSHGCKLRQTGRSWKGLSPLRTEKTPSFYVYPDQGSWYDFGISEGGDLFAYMMKRDGCDFKAAAAALGDFAGIERYWESDQLSSSDKDKYLAEILMRSEMFATYRILTDAIHWYSDRLPDFARKIYNEGYGLTDETIERFKLGWGFLGLWEYLRETQKFSEEACLRTGLFIKTKVGIKEFFANRLVLPYWMNGEVRYAIGRRVEGHTSDEEWDKGKYKKLLTHDKDKAPYVSIHIENDIFFNEDVLRRSVDEVVVTEGITDCISLDQHGFCSISPVTTAFRERDKPRLAKLLERVGKHGKIIICNDADVTPDGKKPGERGALKTAAFLYSLGYSVFIATLPRPQDVTKIDVCDYLRLHGKDAMRKVLDESKKYLDYIIDLVPVEAEPAEKANRLDPVIEAIASRPPIEREAHLRRISNRFDIKMSTLEAMARKFVPEIEAAKEEVKEDKKKKASDPFSPNLRVRGEVFEELDERGCYYAARGRDGIAEAISSFVLTPKRKIVLEDHEILRCDITCTSGLKFPDRIFEKKAWRSDKDFRDSLPSPDMQWTGDSNQVQGVLRLLSSQTVPSQCAVRTLGYHEYQGERMWIWPEHTMNAAGVVDNPPTLYLGTAANDFASRLRYVLPPEDQTRELARKMLPLILSINEPAIVMQLIGYFFATPFKPRIQRIIGHFPILWMYGTQGSGKTNALQVFWRLFGASKVDPYGDITPSSIMHLLASTSSVPVFVDEVKKKDMSQRVYAAFMKLLREVYGDSTAIRATVHGTTMAHRVSAPLVVASESIPEEDQALVERLICVSPKKTTLDDPSKQRAFAELRSMPLGDLAGPYVRWSLSQEVPAALEMAMQVTKQMLARAGHPNAPPRIHDAAAVTTFGMAMFDSWFQSMGIRVPDMDTSLLYSEIASQVIRGEGAQAKDAFDFFLEQVSVYIHTGLLEDGVHYATTDASVAQDGHVVPQTTLRLHLHSCYEVYLAERRRTGREDETHGLRALQRLAKEKAERPGSYIMNASIRTDMRNPKRSLNGALPTGVNDRGQLRCVEIDQGRIPDELDFKRIAPSSVLQQKAAGMYGSYGSS